MFFDREKIIDRFIPSLIKPGEKKFEIYTSEEKPVDRGKFLGFVLGDLMGNCRVVDHDVANLKIILKWSDEFQIQDKKLYFLQQLHSIKFTAGGRDMVVYNSTFFEFFNRIEIKEINSDSYLIIHFNFGHGAIIPSLEYHEKRVFLEMKETEGLSPFSTFKVQYEKYDDVYMEKSYIEKSCIDNPQLIIKDTLTHPHASIPFDQPFYFDNANSIRSKGEDGIFSNFFRWKFVSLKFLKSICIPFEHSEFELVKKIGIAFWLRRFYGDDEPPNYYHEFSMSPFAGTIVDKLSLSVDPMSKNFKQHNWNLNIVKTTTKIFAEITPPDIWTSSSCYLDKFDNSYTPLICLKIDAMGTIGDREFSIIYKNNFAVDYGMCIDQFNI